MVTKEAIADKITELVLTVLNIDIEDYQKTVIDGIIQRGRDSTDPESFAVLYESDVVANLDDLGVVDGIYNYFYSSGYGDDVNNLNQLNIKLEEGYSGNGRQYRFVYGAAGQEHFVHTATATIDNLNQLLEISRGQAPIDSQKAAELLDTHIYELLPPLTTKQQRINSFFLSDTKSEQCL